MSTTLALEKQVLTLDEATVRFCGDSGDGMQLAGTQFTNTSALMGNDIATFPDFPAEIRAPQGTLAGVSGFQVHFSSKDIYTPGDTVDALVAMNPTAGTHAPVHRRQIRQEAGDRRRQHGRPEGRLPLRRNS